MRNCSKITEQFTEVCRTCNPRGENRRMAAEIAACNHSPVQTCSVPVRLREFSSNLVSTNLVTYDGRIDCVFPGGGWSSG